MTRVAVVGLGAMGSRMAVRLLDRGHEVVVWNRTRARAEPLLERGATSAGSPAEAAQAAEVTLTMLADPAATTDVVVGSDGIAAGLGAGTLVQMGTIGVAATRALAAALPVGAGFLDAPVLGSTGEVEQGTLHVFASGDADLAERWTPLLSDLGQVRYLGPVGHGSAAKLVANATLVDTLAVLGELLALGSRLGLSTETVFDVLAITPMAPQAQRRRESLLNDDFPLRFELALACKDADLVHDAAAEAGVDVRVADAARSWFHEADAAGRGREDYARVISHILERRDSNTQL